MANEDQKNKDRKETEGRGQEQPAGQGGERKRDEKKEGGGERNQ